MCSSWSATRWLVRRGADGTREVIDVTADGDGDGAGSAAAADRHLVPMRRWAERVRDVVTSGLDASTPLAAVPNLRRRRGVRPRPRSHPHPPVVVKRRYSTLYDARPDGVSQPAGAKAAVKADTQPAAVMLVA